MGRKSSTLLGFLLVTIGLGMGAATGFVIFADPQDNPLASLLAIAQPTVDPESDSSGAPPNPANSSSASNTPAENQPNSESSPDSDAANGTNDTPPDDDNTANNNESSNPNNLTTPDRATSDVPSRDSTSNPDQPNRVVEPVRDYVRGEGLVDGDRDQTNTPSPSSPRSGQAREQPNSETASTTTAPNTEVNGTAATPRAPNDSRPDTEIQSEIQQIRLQVLELLTRIATLESQLESESTEQPPTTESTAEDTSPSATPPTSSQPNSATPNSSNLSSEATNNADEPISSPDTSTSPEPPTPPTAAATQDSTASSPTPSASPSPAPEIRPTVPEGFTAVQGTLLDSNPTPPPRMNLGTQTISLPGDVLFDFNKSDIRPEAADLLRQVSKLLESMPAGRIQVAGHTDNIGAPQYNLELSLARANAVRAFLREAMIGDNARNYRWTSVGYGATSPVATNDTDEGRQRNRRVDLIVTP